MPFDAHRNFARGLVATAPSPATTGTTLTLQQGQGSLFSVLSNIVLCPAGSDPQASTAEIARITGISSDTLTITRAQEGTSAQAVASGWQCFAGPTAKTFTDIESSVTGRGWLGLNGNSQDAENAENLFSELGVVWDRVEVTAGASSGAAGLVQASIGYGMIPVVLIDDANYASGGGLPTGSAITTYAQGFVQVVQQVLAISGTTPVMFEVTNEPWYRSGATAAQYADVVYAVLQACEQANIPLTQVLVQVQNEAWATGMYSEQPALETLVEGWSVHPYGPPPPGQFDGQGIAWLPQLRQTLQSGQDNIVISEIGFWSPDVNGGGNGSAGVAGAAPNGATAGLWLNQTLQTAATFHDQGWLTACIVYARNSGGWGMEEYGSKALSPMGEALINFPEPPSLRPAPGVWSPIDGEMMAATMPDPILAQTQVTPIAGQVHLGRVRVDTAMYVSYIRLTVAKAGASLTANANPVGLYNLAGQLITSTDATSAFESVGEQFVSLGADLVPGYYWIAFLCNGTTMPTLFGMPPINWSPTTATPPRWMVSSATNLTALPSTAALGTSTFPSSSMTFWGALNNG